MRSRREPTPLEKLGRRDAALTGNRDAVQMATALYGPPHPETKILQCHLDALAAGGWQATRAALGNSRL